MKKAIILNAGEGRRLRPLTKDKPKCLLRLNGMTILMHQVTNLAESGIEEIVFVLGYYSDMITKELEKECFDLSFRYIYNPFYHETNTVYSLWLAKDELTNDLLYLNGDVLFHKEVIKRIMSYKRETCLAVDKKVVGKEEVKVCIYDNIIKQIGKEINVRKANAEFVGIAKFSQRFNERLSKKLEEVVEEGRVNEFFEVAVERILGECKVIAVDVSDLPCIEIDTYRDLKKARKIYLKMTEVQV